MEKVLDQAQIDAMVRAARGGRGAEPKSRAPSVSPWDVRQAGQIGREQMHSISTLHETFARNLAHSLGAYLRIADRLRRVHLAEGRAGGGSRGATPGGPNHTSRKSRYEPGERLA
jgi:hypothetical protein